MKVLQVEGAPDAVESLTSVLQRRTTVSNNNDLVAVESEVVLGRCAENQAALRAESTEAGFGPHVLLPTSWPGAASPQETLFLLPALCRRPHHLEEQRHVEALAALIAVRRRYT